MFCMSVHTATRRLEHGAKQLSETNRIAIQDAQEFKIKLLQKLEKGLQNQFAWAYLNSESSEQRICVENK